VISKGQVLRPLGDARRYSEAIIDPCESCDIGTAGEPKKFKV
jgi:hypothetical protein